MSRFKASSDFIDGVKIVTIRDPLYDLFISIGSALFQPSVE